MNIQEMINVLAAFREGKIVEVKQQNHWTKVYYPVWNFQQFEYRVKKEPEVVYLALSPSGTKVYVRSDNRVLHEDSWKTIKKYVEVVDE